MHVKGYGAPETKTAAERARLLIEEAKSRGEPPEDPQLLFSVLHGFAMVNLVTFNGEALRALAEQFLALAQAQKLDRASHDWAPRHGALSAIHW
jgi:hypothetical protein